MTTANEETETQADKLLNEFISCGYTYLSTLYDRYKRRLYFTEGGKARLACILGYITGLHHAGQQEFAGKLVEDLEKHLQRLSLTDNNAEFPIKRVDGLEAVHTVPGMKCILTDDGHQHSFNWQWYRLLPPDQYEKSLKWHQKRISDEIAGGGKVYDTAHARTVGILKIRERTDPSAPYSAELTEYRWCADGQCRYFYTPHMNGGLIYHGPGAGQTFCVSLDSSPLWGIHT